MNKVSKVSFLIALSFAGLAASASACAQLVSAAYLKQYNEATDYEPLLASVLQDFSGGGEFYARQVIGECRLVRAQLEQWRKKAAEANQDAPDSPRAKAIALLGGRCENISDARLQDPWVDSERVGGVPDPLITAEQDIIQKIRHTSAAPRERARLAGPDRTFEPGKRILIKLPREQQDPLFIDRLTRKWQLPDPEKSKTRVVYTYLRGSFRPGAEEVVGAASRLAPCEMGLVCDEREFSVAMPCAATGKCDGSREGALRRLFQSRDKDFDNALSTAKELAQSIRDEEGSRLLVLW
ncbi:hypothetical protein G7047_14870 [Diaphorobacter sp. HDW4A]|uniref:hypothetical protein n=1 Tax=Diaphorobacter sp. HDW4A TaxID=2714924 RepID=UPI001408C746|nr:hypothetical protein [Diaphorobacter sp. HDW4A]QIL81037.1 hypothetical protein G7047_14870 [Diaphorobacter sp. HDW4A]